VKKKKGNQNTKISTLFLLITLFLFVILFARTCYLALSDEVDGVNLQIFASKRTTKKETILAKRGAIYDVNGDVLAQNVYSYTLIAYLEESRGEGNYVKDKEKTAKELSTVINMDYDKILKLLNKDSYQTEFSKAGKGLTELQKDKIKALNLDGIDFIESQKRYYPKGDFLSYTLGYAKQNNTGEINGELGLEALYNTELTGNNGSRVYQKDLRGYKIAGTNEVVTDASNGNDIYLTIDSSIQFLVENAIDKVKDKYRFDQINIVVAEAKTGKILALSTYPSFDPNIRDIKNYMDPNVSVAFEPGSTMKIFSYMAVMEKGKYNGNDTFKSGTYKTKDGTVIGDWDRDGWGNITYDKGFAMSSNVGVVNLIKDYLSRKELMDYYKKLGFGSKTDIELANETSGKLAFKYETEVFNAGFGQGIMTTSIQNVKALTSIANDGILLQPYLVDKIVDSKGNVVLQNERKELGRVASKETTDYIKNLMENVVQFGTGTSYKMKGYDLIAKTGTAQIASENGTGYLTGASDVIRGFAGIYPKDDPDIIIYANLKKPRPNSPTALAKLVKEVIENITKIRNNTDVVTEKQEKIEIGTYLNKKVSEVNYKLSSSGIKAITIGDGEKVIKQYPINDIVTGNDKVFLYTGGNIVLENMRGWSKKDVTNYLKLLGISVKFTGVGYVESQSVVSGTNINGITDIEIVLSSKYEDGDNDE